MGEIIMFKPQRVVKFLFLICVSLVEASYQPSFHWDPRNPLFRKNVEINVLQNSKLNIVCPNPASFLQEQDSSTPQDLMYENMWMVDKHEYDACNINTTAPSFSTDNRLLSCNSPLELKYYQMAFRAYQAPGGREFSPGTRYYFIGTSNGIKNSLSNYNGGHCVTSNMKMVIYVCNGSSDPKCTDTPNVSPSPVVSCAPVTETVHRCSTPSLSSSVSSPVLVQQSSPIQLSSAVTVISPTNTALAPISSAAVQCQKFEASIPEGFFSLFANQSNLLAAIYNYTSKIPDLELLLQGLSSSLALKQIAHSEQNKNVTQNCTNEQNNSVIAQSAQAAPACPLGMQAPVLANCSALLSAGYKLSGIYRVDPLDGNGGFGVSCDQENAGGGWAIILRRFDGSLDFDRGWNAYVDGLGDLTGEFWMGLEKMRRLTGDSLFTLRFDLEAPDGEKRYAEYVGCQLGTSKQKFKITVGSYSGDAGDSFTYHNNMKFSTKNNDNDKSSSSCAQAAYGGWWFNDCQQVCLTGRYENGTHSSQGVVGIQWQAWKGTDYSLSKVVMKMRPA